jgi:hypothetical protein
MMDQGTSEGNTYVCVRRFGAEECLGTEDQEQHSASLGCLDQTRRAVEKADKTCALVLLRSMYLSLHETVT